MLYEVFRLACFIFIFFFFKQKTAYEMRISDWSSDVCSSDLIKECHLPGVELAGCRFDDAVLDTVTFWQQTRLTDVAFTRSEERRVGQESVSTCRSRW